MAYIYHPIYTRAQSSGLPPRVDYVLCGAPLERRRDDRDRYALTEKAAVRRAKRALKAPGTDDFARGTAREVLRYCGEEVKPCTRNL